MVLIDQAVLVATATVGQVLPYTSLKKPLAPLTANCTIMTPFTGNKRIHKNTIKTAIHSLVPLHLEINKIGLIHKHISS